MVRDFGRAPVTKDVKPGDIVLWATLPGYERSIQTVHVEAGETREVTIGLREEQTTWWDRTSWKVVIGAGVVALVTGVIVTRQLLEPDYGTPIHGP